MSSFNSDFALKILFSAKLFCKSLAQNVIHFTLQNQSNPYNFR